MAIKRIHQLRRVVRFRAGQLKKLFSFCPSAGKGDSGDSDFVKSGKVACGHEVEWFFFIEQENPLYLSIVECAD